MTPQPPPSPPISDASALGGFDHMGPDDELLVAYLDGELDKGSASAIEIKLASNADLRRRLNDLRATWDLLEELPPAEPNPRFAQSTIEMVAMSAASQSDKKSDRRGRWRWAAALLVMLPAMVGIGYAVVRTTQRLAERQALEVVHILADWEALKEVGSYEWLQKIRTVRDLDRVTKRSLTSGLGAGVVPDSISDRRAWIQKLSDTNRDRLSANLVAFKRTPPAERQPIVDLAKQIYEGPDPLGDLQAARDYYHFVNEMSITDRANHRDQKDAAQRLDDLTWRVNRRMLAVYSQDLSPDSPDRQAVVRWIDEMKQQYGSALGRGVSSDLMKWLSGSTSVIGEEDLDNLLVSLSPEAQEYIGRIRTTEAQHKALVLFFILDAQPFFPGRSSRHAFDRAQLTKSFERLPQSRKAVIEFLPAELAQASLGMPSESDPPNGSRRPGASFSAPFNPGGSTPNARSQRREEVIESSENAPAKE